MYQATFNHPISLRNSTSSDLVEIEAKYTGVPTPRIFDMDHEIPMWETIEFQAYPLMLTKPTVDSWNHEKYCIPIGFAVDELLSPAQIIQNSPVMTLGPSSDGKPEWHLYSRFRNFKLLEFEFEVIPNSSDEFSGEWAMQIIPFASEQTPKQMAMNTQIMFPSDYISEPRSLYSCVPTPGIIKYTPSQSEYAGRFLFPEAMFMRVRFSYMIVREFRENAGLYNDLLPRSTYNWRFNVKSKWLCSGYSNLVKEYQISTRNFGPGKQAGIKTQNWTNSNERYHVWSRQESGQPFALWFVYNPVFFHCLFNGYVARTNKILNPIKITSRRVDGYVEEEQSEEETDYVFV